MRAAMVNLATVLVVGFITVFGVFIAEMVSDDLVAPPLAHPACQEDQPCWDCTSMGNHVCGEAHR